MAATETLAHLADSGNFDNSQISLSPRRGVITLSGYGINVRVDRGHLLLEDGIGTNRFKTRLPRVGHGLKRLADFEVTITGRFKVTTEVILSQSVLIQPGISAGSAQLGYCNDGISLLKASGT